MTMGAARHVCVVLLAACAAAGAPGDRSVWNECEAHGAVCAAASPPQVCVDADTAADAVGDWMCTCPLPWRGDAALRRAAACVAAPNNATDARPTFFFPFLKHEGILVAGAVLAAVLSGAASGTPLPALRPLVAMIDCSALDGACFASTALSPFHALGAAAYAASTAAAMVTGCLAFVAAAWGVCLAGRAARPGRAGPSLAAGAASLYVYPALVLGSARLMLVQLSGLGIFLAFAGMVVISGTCYATAVAARGKRDGDVVYIPKGRALPRPWAWCVPRGTWVARSDALLAHVVLALSRGYHVRRRWYVMLDMAAMAVVCFVSANPTGTPEGYASCKMMVAGVALVMAFAAAFVTPYIQKSSSAADVAASAFLAAAMYCASRGYNSLGTDPALGLARGDAATVEGLLLGAVGAGLAHSVCDVVGVVSARSMAAWGAPPAGASHPLVAPLDLPLRRVDSHELLTAVESPHSGSGSTTPSPPRDQEEEDGAPPLARSALRRPRSAAEALASSRSRVAFALDASAGDDLSSWFLDCPRSMSGGLNLSGSSATSHCSSSSALPIIRTSSAPTQSTGRLPTPPPRARSLHRGGGAPPEDTPPLAHLRVQSLVSSVSAGTPATPGLALSAAKRPRRAAGLPSLPPTPPRWNTSPSPLDAAPSGSPGSPGHIPLRPASRLQPNTLKALLAQRNDGAETPL